MNNLCATSFLRHMDHTAPKSHAAPVMILVFCILFIAAAGMYFVFPRMIGRTADSKLARARADMATIRGMLQTFRLDTGRYPTKVEGLKALSVAPPKVSGWRGPYIAGPSPLDPWGNKYVYSDGPRKDEFTLQSYGADGKPGGAGPATDIDAN